MPTRKRRSRGEGSVVELTDGRWQGRITVQGNRKVVHGHTKQEAADKLRELIRTTDKPPDTRTRVAQWVRQWLAGHKEEIEPATLDYYTRALKRQIIPHIGDVELAALTPDCVAQWQRDLQEAGDPPGTRRNAAVTLRTALNAAVKRGLLTKNPVKVARKTRFREIHPLPPPGVTRFLLATKEDRYYPLYLLALDSGMRQGELFALHGREVDLYRCEIKVLYNLERVSGRLRRKTVKTPASRRTLPIDEHTLDALRPLITDLDRPVFRNRRGGYLRGNNLVRDSFGPACQAAGLPPAFRFHDLRHTMATLALANGHNLKEVSERLGHADPVTTLKIYSHCLPGAGRRIARTLGGILQGISGLPNGFVELDLGQTR